MLAETPARAVAFLRGVRTHDPVRRWLINAGYSERHHAGVRLLGEALRMLDRVDARDRDADAPASTGHADDVDPAFARAGIEAAAAECEAFVRSDLRRARAALVHRHPDQEAFLFGPITGSAVDSDAFATELFLSQLDRLEHADAAAGDPAAVQAALATLVDRGFTTERRAHWRDRAKTALGIDQPLVAPAKRDDDEPPCWPFAPGTPNGPNGPRPPTPSCPPATA